MRTLAMRWRRCGTDSRRRFLLVAGMATVTVGACIRSTSPGDIPGVTGSYRLVAVDAVPLPAPSNGGLAVRGTFTVLASSHYTLVETDSTPGGGTTDFSSSGVWILSDNTFTLKDNGGALYLGSISGSGDSVMVRIGTHLSTYLRQ